MLMYRVIYLRKKRNKSKLKYRNLCFGNKSTNRKINTNKKERKNLTGMYEIEGGAGIFLFTVSAIC